MDLVPAFFLENLLSCVSWNMKEEARQRWDQAVAFLACNTASLRYDQHCKLLTIARLIQWESMKKNSTEATQKKKGKIFLK